MIGHRLLGMTGTVSLRITGACPEDCLTKLAALGVRFRHFQKVDELTICMTVSERDMPLVQNCARKVMCSVEATQVRGIIPRIRAMGLRIVFPVVLLGLLLVVFWLQKHIWFFSVSGNQTIPTEEILWVLEAHQIKFGTVADDLDINTIKNQILADIPELGWITINTEGGMAEVIVRERAEKPVISSSSSPANVVAKKSGLITDVDVTGGTAQVKKGSVVSEGDLLISGVTNLDKTMLLTRAEGEVYARTWNRIDAVLPSDMQKKSYSGREKTYYSLTIGKKTLNFYKTSGISYTNYDKIMESKELTLPGGYTFPVTVTRTVVREYTAVPAPPEEDAARAQLEHSARAQIRSELTAGSILNQNLVFRQEEHGSLLAGVIECQEEIGSLAEIKD